MDAAARAMAGQSKNHEAAKQLDPHAHRKTRWHRDRSAQGR